MTQAESLKILKTGVSVFLTGEPGSGKTHTINSYVEYLRSSGIEPAITASTGIAATHIGGMTIHSWSGIGVKENLSRYDLEEIETKERVVKRITAAKVLIIDEISMLSAETLDAVELVCRSIRRNDEPFGGLQVVFVGDFFQLPPVNKNGTATLKKFAFNSESWNKLKPLVCYLSEQFRQSDETFLMSLTQIRRGEVTSELREFLSLRVFDELPSKKITKLFPHNADVDRINNEELNLIEGETAEYLMHGKGAPFLVETLKKSCLSPEKLAVKIGAKVMFTKNSIDGNYVNGTVGEVAGYGKSGYPLVRLSNGKKVEALPVEWQISDGKKVLASISQVPLRLAWAITVHKSQGMSMDSALIDLRMAFEYGQGYVALSRVRALEGLYLLGFNERALEVHPEVRKFDESLRLLSDEVADAFNSMPNDEIKILQDNFLKAIGGVPGSGKKIKEEKLSTYAETLEMLRLKLSIDKIAEKRKLTEGTILSHVEKLVSSGAIVSKQLIHLRPAKSKLADIGKIFQKNKDMKLKDVYLKLNGKYTYEDIRLAKLFLTK